MNEMENELKNILRRGPSAGLDARMERSLQNAAPIFSRPVPLWACALAAIIGIAAGAILFHLPPSDEMAGGPKSVVIASADIKLPSFPFIGRSFVQP